MGAWGRALQTAESLGRGGQGKQEGWLAGATTWQGCGPPNRGGTWGPRGSDQISVAQTPVPWKQSLGTPSPLGAPEKLSLGPSACPSLGAQPPPSLGTPDRGDGGPCPAGPWEPQRLQDPQEHSGCKAAVEPAGSCMLKKHQLVIENTCRPWALSDSVSEQPRQAGTSARPGHPDVALLA